MDVLFGQQFRSKLSQSQRSGTAFVLLAAITIVAIWSFPLATLLLLCVFSALFARGRQGSILLLCLASGILFTLLNLTKQLNGDLVNYVNLAHYISTRPFQVLFDPRELAPVGATYRVTEIGFESALWTLAHIFGGSEALIAIAGSAVIYATSFAALKLIGTAQGWTDEQLLTILFFVAFGALNFLDTTHLLRQYVSASIAFLAVGFYFTSRRVLAVSTAIYACAVHNGTIIPVMDSVGIAILLPHMRYREFSLLTKLMRVGAAVSLLVISIVLVWLDTLHHSPSVNAAHISLAHFIVAGGILILAIFGYYAAPRCQNRQYYYCLMAYTAIFLVSTTFYIVDIKLLALRFFDYLQWLFGVILGLIFMSVAPDRPALQIALRWSACGIALAVFVWRLHEGPWVYGPADRGILTIPFDQLAGYLKR